MPCQVLRTTHVHVMPTPMQATSLHAVCISECICSSAATTRQPQFWEDHSPLAAREGCEHALDTSQTLPLVMVGNVGAVALMGYCFRARVCPPNSSSSSASSIRRPKKFCRAAAAVVCYQCKGVSLSDRQSCTWASYIKHGSGGGPALQTLACGPENTLATFRHDCSPIRSPPRDDAHQQHAWRARGVRHSTVLCASVGQAGAACQCGQQVVLMKLHAVRRTPGQLRCTPGSLSRRRRCTRWRPGCWPPRPGTRSARCPTAG